MSREARRLATLRRLQRLRKLERDLLAASATESGHALQEAERTNAEAQAELGALHDGFASQIRTIHHPRELELLGDEHDLALAALAETHQRVSRAHREHNTPPRRADACRGSPHGHRNPRRAQSRRTPPRCRPQRTGRARRPGSHPKESRLVSTIYHMINRNRIGPAPERRDSDLPGASEGGRRFSGALDDARRDLERDLERRDAQRGWDEERKRKWDADPGHVDVLDARSRLDRSGARPPGGVPAATRDRPPQPIAISSADPSARPGTTPNPSLCLVPILAAAPRLPRPRTRRAKPRALPRKAPQAGDSPAAHARQCDSPPPADDVVRDAVGDPTSAAAAFGAALPSSPGGDGRELGRRGNAYPGHRPGALDGRRHEDPDPAGTNQRERDDGRLVP